MSPKRPVPEWVLSTVVLSGAASPPALIIAECLGVPITLTVGTVVVSYSLWSLSLAFGATPRLPILKGDKRDAA